MKLNRGGWPALLSKVGVAEVTFTVPATNTTVLTVEGPTLLLGAVVDVQSAGGANKSMTITAGGVTLTASLVNKALVLASGLGDGPALIPADGTVVVSGNAAVPVTLRLLLADVGSLK